MTKKPYETFDVDLLDGRIREDAFARMLCEARFEHKRDYQTAKTGNVAIEYQVRNQDGTIDLSGIAVTTAEWWVTEYAEDCRLILPTALIKRLARLAIREERHAWIGDGQNHHNALIPFHWLLNPKLTEVV